MRAAALLLLLLQPAPVTRAGAAEADPALALALRGQEAKGPLIERLLDRLGVEPGMTALDLGAGTGQHSYRLAARLKGSGRVYATDIDPLMTRYMASQARARGLDNLEPVLVRPEGLDPFYGKHRFDLVLVSDVYNFIEDRVAYFGRLRGSLAPGGRVVVVSYPDRTHGFAREDFSDWEGFLADLEKEPGDGPFGRRLAAPVLAARAALPAGDECGREAAVLSALKALVESDLYTLFAKDGALPPETGVTPEEAAYALVRIARLELTGFPGRVSAPQLSLSDRHMLAYVNKLLVIARYRRRLVSGGPRPYLSEGLESRWHRDADFLAREMAQAGYRLQRRFDVVPFQAAWVFVSDGKPWTAPAPEARAPSDPLALAVRAQQAKAPQQGRLLEALAAQPGMRVLDLGAGTGQMSYRLAAELGGRLLVDAADVDPALTRHVGAQAKERGLSNIEAFTVSADGRDGFPAGRRYDRVLLYDVLSYLRDAPAYFSRLRGRMAPGGRLVVVAYPGREHDFTRPDVRDWEGLAGALASEPAASPLSSYLGRPLSRSLARLPRGAPDCQRERATLFHLNRVLDSDLFALHARGGALDPELPLTPEEREMGELLLRRAELAGVPARRSLASVDGIEAHMIALLNRLILVARLRPYLAEGGGAPHRPRASGPDAVAAAVTAGGWRLRGRSRFNLLQDAWVFE